MSDQPERIYLQDGGGDVLETLYATGDITWCVDKINEDDTEYIRADTANATIEQLRGAILTHVAELAKMKAMLRTHPSPYDLPGFQKEIGVAIEEFETALSVNQSGEEK